MLSKIWAVVLENCLRIFPSSYDKMEESLPNSFTLVHFLTLARPLQYLLFCFLFKTINIMIYFYVCGFNNNDTNPSFYEEQLSATEARSGFGWIFSRIARQLTSENFHTKRKKKTATTTVEKN